MSVAALDPPEYVRLVGTETPTLDEIRAKRNELMDWRSRWMGIAAIAYSQGRPDKIVFTGFSGD